MYIHEAVAKAVAEDKYIVRTDSDFFKGVGLKLKPTNTDDCIVCINPQKEKPSPRWNPKSEDLTSDKWEVVD